MEKSIFFFVRKLFYHTFAHAKNATDSVAQLVEHIPFKDGVLGSNPSWITKHTMLRQEHFLFNEGNETLVSDSLRKTKNDKARRSRDGIVCFDEGNETYLLPVCRRNPITIRNCPMT